MSISAARVEALFTESGALRSGHFALKSGRHGDRYLEKFQVLQFPAAVSELCAAFADPGLPVRLIDELAAWCAERGLGSFRDVIGGALPARRDRPSVKGVEYRP